MRLERPSALNDDPLFIGALAELVRERAARGWRGARRVRVAVIGGGIAGLAAARRLEALAPEAAVSLVERDVVLGGKIRTDRLDGFVVETAPDSFLSRRSAASACAGARARRRAHRAAARASRELRAPRRRTASAPRGPHRDDPDEPRRARDDRAPLRAGKVRFAAEADVPPSDGVEDESVAAFVSRRFGREAYDGSSSRS
jgi:oxygen-dependent protoporphyrinogen oxidase